MYCLCVYVFASVLMCLLLSYLLIFIHSTTCQYTSHSHTISNSRCFFHKLSVQEYFRSPTVVALAGLVDTIVCDSPWGLLYDTFKKNIIVEDRVKDDDIKATAEGAAMVLKPETGTVLLLFDPL